MKELDGGDPSAIKSELVIQGRELLSGSKVIDKLILNHPTISEALRLILH